MLVYTWLSIYSPLDTHKRIKTFIKHFVSFVSRVVFVNLAFMFVLLFKLN